MSRSTGRISAAIYLAVSLAASYIVLGSSVAIEDPGFGDIPLLAILGLHYLWGIVLFASSTRRVYFRRSSYRRLLFVPETLAAVSLLFFLFSFIFALNANMDYVQRFISSGGNLRLAVDTRTERLLVWVRIFPFVAVDLATYILFRFGRPPLVRAAYSDRAIPADLIVRPWAFLLTLLSAFLAAVAMPSFLSLDGFPVLGWIAFVPLFLVLRTSRFGHGVFYGVTFGTLTTLLSSYWLGTFSLVSLQITVFFFLVYYLLFTPIALLLYRHIRFARVLVFPLAFTLLEFLRSTGFLGYPWALSAHSQYSVLPIIQMTEVTGVWGLSFLVLLANSALAEFIGALVERYSSRRTVICLQTPSRVRQNFRWLVGVALLVGSITLAGTLTLAMNAEPPADARRVTVAQIQQNNDPRKSEYERTFATLTELTDTTMSFDPDLVVWSETAFVPNIRRWGEDTTVRRFHTLVRSFREYQEELGTWLVTGNDDYEIVVDEAGDEIERLNYNAAVLFDDEGERRETYRKIQLVPFTEHFPYREQLPWVYELLLDFDVNFWEQGQEMTVFEHPRLKFSTPICYEDVFPNYVRGFVLEGAEAIVNITNDYWSLAEVQAKQHFVAALFRAVENRRPMLRTTASGLTGHIDSFGRIVETAPYFEEAWLVSELTIEPEQRFTLYTRAGDYFPIAAGGLLLVLLVAGLAGRRTPPRGEAAHERAPGPASASTSGGGRRGGPRARAESEPDGKAGPLGKAEPEPESTPAAQRKPESEPPPEAKTKPNAEPKPTPKSRRDRSRRGRVNWREIWDDE